MPSQRDIRRRIRSAKNTGQLTKAMQLVAASRMRRAQMRVQESRPYADAIRDVLANLGDISGTDRDRLQQVRERQNVGIVLVTPDRGLCGALPGNLNRAVARFATGQSTTMKFVTVGKKGRDFAVRTRQAVVADHSGYGDYPDIGLAENIATVVIEAFRSGEVDAVYLAYARLVSTLKQEPTIIQLLPVEDAAPADGRARDDGHAKPKALVEFEPSAPDVLSELLPRYVEVQIYQALLESKASEQSARMVAMQAAAENAKDLVNSLTLTYNKVRQANITREIAEITGGSVALSG